MKIVIPAYENDTHAAPVKWAAEQAGYKVACWSGLEGDPDAQRESSRTGNAVSGQAIG